jgi:hypothetical protein
MHPLHEFCFAENGREVMALHYIYYQLRDSQGDWCLVPNINAQRAVSPLKVKIPLKICMKNQQIHIILSVYYEW